MYARGAGRDGFGERGRARVRVSYYFPRSNIAARGGRRAEQDGTDATRLDASTLRLDAPRRVDDRAGCNEKEKATFASAVRNAVPEEDEKRSEERERARRPPWSRDDADEPDASSTKGLGFRLYPKP